MKKIIEPQIVRCSKANDFMGIKIDDGKVDLYVPSFFRKSEDEKEYRKDILLFLNSLGIAKTQVKENIKTNKNTTEENWWPVDSYLWLLKDYLLNGVFYNREKVYVNEPNGKIDWKRTLRTHPIVSNGNVVYNNIITSKTIPTNDLVSHIYMICVYQSYYRIGWLFGYNLNIKISQKKSVSEMISVIARELKNTFDDVKKLRFKHMLKVLNNIEGLSAVTKQYTYGIENYYYVFERMVDSLLGGISKSDMENYYPNGIWSLLGETDFDSSNMYPDTINIRDDYYYIIDAKMYQFGVTGNHDDLPKTQSIQKQVTYGDYVKTKVPVDSKIRNAFIMPYDKYNNPFINNTKFVRCLDNNLIYVGNANITWREDQHKEDFDYIHTFLIDYSFLLHNYKKEDVEMIEALCEMIETHMPMDGNK